MQCRMRSSLRFSAGDFFLSLKCIPILGKLMSSGLLDWDPPSLKMCRINLIKWSDTSRKKLKFYEQFYRNFKGKLLSTVHQAYCSIAGVSLNREMYLKNRTQLLIKIYRIECNLTKLHRLVALDVKSDPMSRALRADYWIWWYTKR